jgi:hypothetical protein
MGAGWGASQVSALAPGFFLEIINFKKDRNISNINTKIGIIFKTWFSVLNTKVDP